MRDLGAGKTIAEALLRIAEVYPENGYTFQDMTGNETFYSWPEVERATASRAAGMQSLGLAKGDRVGMVVIDPEDFVLNFIAASRVGIIPVPLYPPLSMGELDAYMERLARILDTSKSDVLVTSGQLKNVLWGVVDRVPSLRRLVTVETINAFEGEPEFPEVTPDDIAFLQYTSGSTSDPKGVVVTHRSLHANCTSIMSHLGMVPEKDTSLSWLPLYHDMGLIGFVLTSIFWGNPSVFLPTLRFLKRPNIWMDAVDRHRAKITFCPPFALGLAARRAKPEQLEKWDLSCLEIVGVGAEPINPDAAREFTELFREHCNLPDNAILPAYGMAEATLAITLKPVNESMRTRFVDAERFQDEGLAIDAAQDSYALEHVSCGIPFPGHEIRIIDSDGDELPEDVEGQICLSGPSVTRGYYLNSKATAEAFIDGWLHTGDLGYLHDGEVYVTGRLKDLIILNGRNIHPQSIEWSVANLEGVRKGNVVAFSRPGANTEEIVIVLEAKPDAPEDLKKRVADRILSEYGLPVAEIVVLDRGLLPKTSSGKLQRAKTRQLYLGRSLGSNGSRQKDAMANKLTLARHLARSVWTRVKYRTFR